MSNVLQQLDLSSIHLDDTSTLSHAHTPAHPHAQCVATEADFTPALRTHYQCVSNIQTKWSVLSDNPARHPEGYLITFSLFDHKHPEHGPGYACTCPAYRYREGYCKHITRLVPTLCLWDSYTEGSSPILAVGYPNSTADYSCPRCGAQAIPTLTEVR